MCSTSILNWQNIKLSCIFLFLITNSVSLTLLPLLETFIPIRLFLEVGIHHLHICVTSERVEGVLPSFDINNKCKASLPSYFQATMCTRLRRGSKGPGRTDNLDIWHFESFGKLITRWGREHFPSPLSTVSSKGSVTKRL